MWTQHILNPEIVSGIFKKQEPSLKQITMQEVSVILGDDLVCKINFDLKDFPIDPPLKWVSNKFNTAQMSLALISANISNFHIQSGDMIGDLSISFGNSCFTIEFTTVKNVPIFSATSKWIRIDKLSGYSSDLR